MTRYRAVVALAAGWLLAGCGAGANTQQAAPTASVNDSSAAPASNKPSDNAFAGLPAGWRWESYRDVVIGVPATWGYENGSQRTGQWCIGDNPKPAAIGRPGASTAAGCPAPAPGEPPPGTLIAVVGEFVAFDPAGDPAGAQSGSAAGARTEGDRTTIRVGSVGIAVQAEAGLREQIVSTARQVDVDHNGCPSLDPISIDPGSRPDNPVAAGSLRAVQRVSACRYALRSDFITLPPGPTLISSLQLAGDQAAAVITGIAAAPAGSGPNSPDSCSTEVRYGDEVIVLRVTAEAGESQIYLRFSGCDHHGYDDGADVRTLTRAVVTQLIKDSNTPLSWGMEVGDVLGHDIPAATAAP